MSSLIFVGCDSTSLTNSVCEGNKFSVEGLEGSYSTNIMGTPATTKITKVAEAKYEVIILGEDGDPIDEEDILTLDTCILGDKVYAENMKEGEYSLYSFEKISKKRTLFSQLKFDIDSIRDLGAPVSIKESDFGVVRALIDNSELEVADLLSVESDSSFQFILKK